MEKIIIKRKRKKNIILPLLLLLFFFILYFVLQDFGIYVYRERNVFFNEPHNITKEVTFERQEVILACENKSFIYATQGGNVESIGNNVRPNLILHNLENRWGEYKVNFSFVDEGKYPYNIYGGENLIKNIESEKISWKDGDFFSVTYNILMPPMEAVLIDDLTEKKDENRNYWAMANIIEPKYEYCYDKITAYNVTENRNFIENRQEARKVKVREYTKIFDIIKVESFGQWIIIVLMFFLIFLLLSNIWEKYDLKKKISKVYYKD